MIATASAVQIGVVIPCFRVRRQILSVLERIGPECFGIYVVDDACPEETGRYVRENVTDPRVRVITHAVNQGVGGAVISGYRAASRDGCTIIVKLDGDGQMDPALLPNFVLPILEGEADYTKGNRFFSPETISRMPWTRFLGNAGLSFLAKASSGYWRLFDPTNGFTAIHAALLEHIDLDKVDRRFFFESDMLFRLGTVRACVVDIPMVAVYGDEKSNFRAHRLVWQFLRKHVRNLGKRIAYNYFIRDFSLASLLLAFSVVFLLFGVLYGGAVWTRSVVTGDPSSVGNVVAPALAIIIALNLFLSFLAYDLASTPSTSMHRLLARRSELPSLVGVAKAVVPVNPAKAPAPSESNSAAGIERTGY